MSTNIGVSSCCISGKVHEGTPAGREETIGGIPCYVAEPSNYSKAKTVIFITDIFGWKLNNVRLLADNYAKSGFYVYIPDLHDGNSLPESFLQNVEPPLKVQENLGTIDKAKNTAVVASTLGPWLITHREGVTRPLVDGFVNTVRMIPDTNKIGALGFCWGGRYAILLAHGKDGSGAIAGVDCAVACHPSLLAVPGDFEGVTKPLSLAFGEKDSLVDEKTRGGILDVLAKKTDVPHEIRIYEDQIHGFALRGDWSSDKDKKAMDEVEKQAQDWFSKYLA